MTGGELPTTRCIHLPIVVCVHAVEKVVSALARESDMIAFPGFQVQVQVQSSFGYFPSHSEETRSEYGEYPQVRIAILDELGEHESTKHLPDRLLNDVRSL